LLLDPQVAQMGNGFMAVIAGIVSQLSADYLGDIGPFQVICVATRGNLFRDLCGNLFGFPFGS
jgi:hypothetical protein